MRVIWIVLDSAGIGAMPDAETYGDKGADTFGHIAEAFTDFRIPNLRALGLGRIDGANPSIGRGETGKGDPLTAYGRAINEGRFMYGRAAELSRGKDSVTGHWEMIGIETKIPFRTCPEGFPPEMIEPFIREAGLPGVLGNCVASGTAIIQELGEEHERTGKPIVYTSQDSVFQIAASEETFGLERLYRICEIARKELQGDKLMARVIARPFVRGEKGFVRTANRHDYAVPPGDTNLLAYLKDAGVPVTSVGKIYDLFCGCGIKRALKTKSNADGIDKTLLAMDEEKEGLIFTNLVEFDSTWGHRRDVQGYGEGLEYFDGRLPEILGRMTGEDVLILTADHGCDPSYRGTDHTREYVPVLIYGQSLPCSDGGRNIGTRETFADMGATVGKLLGAKELPVGRSIL